jgi:hypothetical protein
MVASFSCNFSKTSAQGVLSERDIFPRSFFDGEEALVWLRSLGNRPEVVFHLGVHNAFSDERYAAISKG